MNKKEGRISEIITEGQISFVKVIVGESSFSAILIDTPSTSFYLKIGNNVNVLFKETEVIIGKGEVNGISLQNKFAGKIQSIEKIELLSKIIVDTQIGIINSIITSNAVSKLDLKKGMEVTAMIKTNEIMLSQINQSEQKVSND